MMKSNREDINKTINSIVQEAANTDTELLCTHNDAKLRPHIRYASPLQSAANSAPGDKAHHNR